MSTRRGYFALAPYNPSRPGAPVIVETTNGTFTRSLNADPPPHRNEAKYRLALPSGVTGLASVSIGRGAAVPHRESADIATRVRFINGNGNANGRFMLALGRGPELAYSVVDPGPPPAYAWVFANGGYGSLTDQMATLSLLGDGTIELGAVVDGSYSSIATGTGPGSSARAAEAGVWLRFARSPSSLSAWWGVSGDDVDALPSRWTCALVSHDIGALTASSGMKSLRMSIEAASGITGGLTVDVLDNAWLGAFSPGGQCIVTPAPGEETDDNFASL